MGLNLSIYKKSEGRVEETGVFLLHWRTMLQFQSLKSFWAGGTEGNDRNCPGTERTGMCSSTHYTGDRQFRNAQTGSVACTTESISTALSRHHSSTHLYSCLIAMTIFWHYRAFELCCLTFRNKVNEVKCACFGRLLILTEYDRQSKIDRKLQDAKVQIEGMQMTWTQMATAGRPWEHQNWEASISIHLTRYVTLFPCFLSICCTVNFTNWFKKESGISFYRLPKKKRKKISKLLAAIGKWTVDSWFCSHFVLD